MPTGYPLALPSKLRQSTLAAYNGNTGPMSKILGDIGEDIEQLAARIGVAGSSDAYSLDYQTRGVETAYTPVASTPTGALTMPCTWTGSFSRATNAKIGRLSIRGQSTGTWSVGSGNPFLELTMPSGWTAAASRECANGMGIGYPAAGLGQHAVLFPVVHAGATKIRFISRANSADGYFYAIDGVGSPFGVVNNDTVFDGVFDVRLA